MMKAQIEYWDKWDSIIQWPRVMSVSLERLNITCLHNIRLSVSFIGMFSIMWWFVLHARITWLMMSVQLSPRQVKTPKYNCPQGLYSDTTMDEMISGSSSVEWVHILSTKYLLMLTYYQALKTIFTTFSFWSAQVNLILRVQPMPRWWKVKSLTPERVKC